MVRTHIDHGLHVAPGCPGIVGADVAILHQQVAVVIGVVQRHQALWSNEGYMSVTENVCACLKL